jgi:hypothetical protein
MFAASTGCAGRLLSYTRSDDAWLAAVTVARHQASGLVVLGRDAATFAQWFRAHDAEQLLVVDVDDWSKAEEASAVAPVLPAEDGLFPIHDVDTWATSMINAGADVVLTRSLFVPLAAWEAVRAVLHAGASATRPDVMTLVATDAGMLDRAHRSEFLRMLERESGGRPLAFVFAGPNQPMAHRERIRGLRSLLDRHPGSLLVGVDVLTATDAITRGAGAAIGITGTLRRPKRPKDPNGGSAANFVPGLFLRELWETRSPTIYADWYANKQGPTCTACGGRSMDSFTNDIEDKRQIRVHNIHAWLTVLDELRHQVDQAQRWLKAERLRALEAHAALRPLSGRFEADRLLRRLCELDDPEQRRTTTTGQWR